MTQLPPAPAAQPPDTVKVRGRLRAVWLPLWLAAAVGCVPLGMYGDTPEDTLGSHQVFLSLFLLLAAVLVVVGVRSFGRGLDADGDGVVVRKMLRATSIPWHDLAAIDFKGVDSEALSNMYYTLVFLRQDGSRVTTDAPGGGIRPGEYLFELRERLLAMQSAALGYRQRDEDQQGDPEDSWPAYPDAPADRPSDAAGTDDEVAIPATRSRVKRWAVLLPVWRWRWHSSSSRSPAPGGCCGMSAASYMSTSCPYRFTGKICSPACASATIQTERTTSSSTVMPSTRKRSYHGAP